MRLRVFPNLTVFSLLTDALHHNRYDVSRLEECDDEEEGQWVWNIAQDAGLQRLDRVYIQQYVGKERAIRWRAWGFVALGAVCFASYDQDDEDDDYEAGPAWYCAADENGVGIA